MQEKGGKKKIIKVRTELERVKRGNNKVKKGVGVGFGISWERKKPLTYVREGRKYSFGPIYRPLRNTESKGK